MINLQEEEQTIEYLDNIEGMQIVIQVISFFVFLCVSLLLLLYCTKYVDTCIQLLNTVFHSFPFYDYLEIHVGLIYLLKSLILQRQYDLGTFHSHRL